MTQEEQHSREREQDEGRWRWVIGLLFTLVPLSFGHLGVAIWWASGIDNRVEQIEENEAESATRDDQIEGVVASQSTALAVLAARVEEQNRRVEETNDLLREYLRRNGGYQP